MNELRLSTHAEQMLHERQIPEEWVWCDDNNMHYMKAIPERGGRVLHIVVNEDWEPNRIVTLFFDRRLTREWKS